MKQAFAASRLLFLSVLLFLYSCQKEQSPSLEADGPKTEMAVKVAAWLDGRLAKANTPEKQAKIKALKDHLQLSKLWTEEFADGELFVLIPIKEGLPSKHNAGKQKSSTLSLIVNKAGEIRKGKIVQYLPVAGDAALPRGTLNSIYNFKKLKHDGTFTFLNLLDKRIEEYIYKNGELHSWSALDTKPTDAQRTQEQVCIDWYWVTTLSDGTQIWEFMYRTCRDSNGCRPDEECDVVGGGGGLEILAEDFAPREKEWEVVKGTDIQWEVISTEGFTGRRDSTGSRFTYTGHVQDKLFPTAQTYILWTRTEMNNWGEGTATAHARIKGIVEKDGGLILRHVNETKDFPFNTVFQ